MTDQNPGHSPLRDHFLRSHLYEAMGQMNNVQRVLSDLNDEERFGDYEKEIFSEAARIEKMIWGLDRKIGVHQIETRENRNREQQ